MIDILRRLLQVIDTPSPNESRKNVARMRLREHIEVSSGIAYPGDDQPVAELAENRSRRRRRLWVPAAVIVSLVAVTVAVVTIRPAEVTALAHLAAEVVVLPAEALGVVDIERHTLTRSFTTTLSDPRDPSTERIPIFVSLDRRERQSADRILEITRTVTSIEFSSEVDEETIKRVEDEFKLHVPRSVTAPLGEEYYIEQRLLSDDPDVLEARIRSQIDLVGNPDLDDAVEVFNKILDLFNTYVLEPQVRAAALTVMNRLEDATSSISGDVVTSTIEYDTPLGREAQSASFDSNGWLIAESLTSLDGVSGVTDETTVLFEAVHAPPIVTP